MARQWQLPNGAFLNETTTRQWQSPFGGYINEQGGAAALPSATVAYTESDDVSALTANTSVSNPSAVVNYTESNDTSAITANAAASTGTVTTSTFKNNTGTVLASLAGLTVTVLSLSTLGFVKTFTSKTTDAVGVMVITDALLISGTQYVVVTTNAAGTLGVEKYTAV